MHTRNCRLLTLSFVTTSGGPQLIMSAPQPRPRAYMLCVPSAFLVLLREKLDKTRLPDELEDAGWMMARV